MPGLQPACSATHQTGPGQVRGHKMVALATTEEPRILYMSADGQEHVSHLIVLGGLKMLGRLISEKSAELGLRFSTYYATLDKVACARRECAIGMYNTWVKLRGPPRHANAHEHRRMPEDNSARWGAVQGVEAQLLAAGKATVASVLTDVRAARATMRGPHAR